MELGAFKQNLDWNIRQIAIQFSQAEKVNGRARSGFYKAAVISAASVVEALAFKLLETNEKLEMPLGDWLCKDSNFLPLKYITNDGARLSICKRTQERFKLTKNTDFKKVNEVCYKLKLFSQQFFKKIEKIRRLRNKIHIQGLNIADRSYTKRELEFISSVMAQLLDKLRLRS
ncbi:hypothetical protein HZA43_05480 [Candidatus Peregrinibacteria bacterium]|nr:hypothetical protein [Candidatus Peregrinibacteria bacterium]